MKRLASALVGIVALGAVLAGCIPAAPPPVPPPPPKFKLAAGLWRTPGTAAGAAECHFERIGADGGVITDVHSDHGARYVQTADSDSEFVTSGCQPWVVYDGSEQPGGTAPIPCAPMATCAFRRSFADGDYIVGHDQPEPATGDVSWGVVQMNNAINVDACQWQTFHDWTGTTKIASGDGNGDGIARLANGVTLLEGEGIRLFDCGGMFWASTS